MGVRVVMELADDNDARTEHLLEGACKYIEGDPSRASGTKVTRCVITTGTVKIEEEFEGNPSFRKQRIVR
jgi:hypothetical protein